MYHFYLIYSISLREKSFSQETEAQKMTEYIKCYDILSKNCYKIYNVSFHKPWLFKGSEVEFQKLMISEDNLGNFESVRKILIYF